MGIGLLELVVIAVVALVLLGPQKLPEIVQQLGRFYVQMRRTSSDLRGVFDNVVRQAEEEARLAEIRRLTDLSKEAEALAMAVTAKASLTSAPYHETSPHQNHDGGSAPIEASPVGRNPNAAEAWEHSVKESSPPEVASTTHESKDARS